MKPPKEKLIFAVNMFGIIYPCTQLQTLICRYFHKEFGIEGAIVAPYAVLELVVTSTG